MNGFSFLLSNVLLYHLIRNGPVADCQIPAGPNVPTPQLPPEMWKFLKEYPRTRPFQPLHNFAYVMMRMIGYEHVNMVV